MVADSRLWSFGSHTMFYLFGICGIDDDHLESETVDSNDIHRVVYGVWS